MNELINAIVGSQEFSEFLLTSVTTVVVAIVGFVAVQARKLIADNTTQTELTALNNIAAIAVTYVEQKFSDLGGPAKYAQAVALANSLIAEAGIKVTVQQLQAIIESAVYTEINSAPGNDPVEPSPSEDVEA